MPVTGLKREELRNAMLWLKALHIFGVIAWFSGIFYLPRLFVYHADVKDQTSHERFVVMERRLYTMMNVGASLAVVFGLWMVLLAPAYLQTGWLRTKLVLVVLVIGYHHYCKKLMRDFAQGKNDRSARWYRVFNEMPALLLLGIVILATVKPF